MAFNIDGFSIINSLSKSKSPKIDGNDSDDDVQILSTPTMTLPPFTPKPKLTELYKSKQNAVSHSLSHSLPAVASDLVDPVPPSIDAGLSSASSSSSSSASASSASSFPSSSSSSSSAGGLEGSKTFAETTFDQAKPYRSSCFNENKQFNRKGSVEFMKNLNMKEFKRIEKITENSSNPEALFDLAQCYRVDINARKANHIKAFELVREAIKLGMQHAEIILPEFYVIDSIAEYIKLNEDELMTPEKGKKMAYEIYQRHAQKDDPFAQYSLAVLYRADHKYVNAFNWHKKAADLGLECAQEAVGECYEHYLGIPSLSSDERCENVVKYYMLAYQQGSLTAQARLLKLATNPHYQSAMKMVPSQIVSRSVFDKGRPVRTIRPPKSIIKSEDSSVSKRKKSTSSHTGISQASQLASSPSALSSSSFSLSEPAPMEIQGPEDLSELSKLTSSPAPASVPTPALAFASEPVLAPAAAPVSVSVPAAEIRSKMKVEEEVLYYFQMMRDNGDTLENAQKQEKDLQTEMLQQQSKLDDLSDLEISTTYEVSASKSKIVMLKTNISNLKALEASLMDVDIDVPLHPMGEKDTKEYGDTKASKEQGRSFESKESKERKESEDSKERQSQKMLSPCQHPENADLREVIVLQLQQLQGLNLHRRICYLLKDRIEKQRKDIKRLTESYNNLMRELSQLKQEEFILEKTLTELKTKQERGSKYSSAFARLGLQKIDVSNKKRSLENMQGSSFSSSSSSGSSDHSGESAAKRLKTT